MQRCGRRGGRGKEKGGGGGTVLPLRGCFQGKRSEQIMRASERRKKEKGERGERTGCTMSLSVMYSPQKGIDLVPHEK